MAAVEAPIIPASVSSGAVEPGPAAHEEAQKAEDAETRAKFDKIVTLLLRKLTEPFIHAENTVNRMHRLLNIALLSEEDSKPTVNVELMIEKVGRIAKKLQRLETALIKDDISHPRYAMYQRPTGRETTDIAEPQRGESILQIFLEKVDALLTRSEASMYAINACCIRVDLERGPEASGHLSQKRFMQLILTRVTRLNNNLSKMEDYMMDVYLESNVELLTEDVLLRPKLGSAAITASQYHDARNQLLARSAFQPDFVAVMHSRARASGEFFAYEERKWGVLTSPRGQPPPLNMQRLAHAHDPSTSPRAGTMTTSHTPKERPIVPPRPATLRVIDRRSGKNLNFKSDTIHQNPSGTLSQPSSGKHMDLRPDTITQSQSRSTHVTPRNTDVITPPSHPPPLPPSEPAENREPAARQASDSEEVRPVEPSLPSTTAPSTSVKQPEVTYPPPKEKATCCTVQ